MIHLIEKDSLKKLTLN